VPKEIPVELDLGLLAVFDPNPLEEEEYRFVAAKPALSSPRS
jgi:regulator of ribosome biosynthesis